MDDLKNSAPPTPAKAPTTVPAVQIDPAPAVEASEPTTTEVAVEAWVDSHIRNSILSRDTVAWNYLTEALKALPAFIEGK